MLSNGDIQDNNVFEKEQRKCKFFKKLDIIEPIFVEYIPEQKYHGKLYISLKYKTSTHLCACGCGQLTIMPFILSKVPKDGHTWGLQLKHNKTVVYFYGSVGNYNFDCKSHYFINDNKIKWI